MNQSIHDNIIQNEPWVDDLPRRSLTQFCPRSPVVRYTAFIYTLIFSFGLAIAQENSEPLPTAHDQPVTENSVVVVEGQILDYMGGGQQGVTVTVNHIGEKDQSGEMVKGEIVASTTTDQYGDFSIEVNEELHGDYFVTFSKSTFTDLIKEVHLGHDDTPVFISEILEGALSLSGLVIDDKTNNPIANVLVTFKTYGRDIEEKTNEQGKFTIQGLTPGAGNLVVEFDGYGREQETVHDIQDENIVMISLKPERIVHVVTLDEFEKPLQGVTVECYDRPRDDFRTLITDEKGSATFTGIHFDADSLSLRITHDDFVSSSEFDERIELPDEKIETTHRLILTRAGTITGQLLDMESGKPVYGARVMTGDEYTDDSPRDWSSDEGRFTITGISPGRIAVTVHISGYAPALKVVDVKSGETTNLNLKLRNAMTLSGVVVDADGKPVRGAFIETTKWRGRTTLNLRSMSTNLGKFVMENAPTDEFEISVRAAGHSRLQKTVKAGGSEPVTIRLIRNSRPGGPSGPDLANEGKPAPDFSLTSMDGKSLKLSELKGKFVLLDFWATWCAPCIEEMNELIKVYEKYGSREDFVMIGISRDMDKPSLKAFLKRNQKIVWPQVYGEEGGVSDAVKNYGITWIPRIFLISKEGMVVGKDLRGETILERIDELLTQKAQADQSSKEVQGPKGLQTSKGSE